MNRVLVFSIVLTFGMLMFGQPTHADISIPSGYLQYRTYSQESEENQYRGWLYISEDNDFIETDIIDQISLQDSSGNPVPIDSTAFWKATYYWGVWDNSSQEVQYSGPYNYSGYSVSFPLDISLGSGDYTYTATLENEEASYTLYFPGQETLPTVPEESIHYQWESDGSLTISWSIPDGNFDRLRLSFMDGESYDDLLYVSLPNDKVSVTVPFQVIAQMLELYKSTSFYLQVQTRRYTYEGMNYARGITSITIPLSWDTVYPDLFQEQQDVEGLRSFRDQILKESPQGSLYTTYLYNNSEEALQVLIENPGLMKRAKQLIEENISAVQSILWGSHGEINNTEQIARFLDAYARKAPPDLKVLAEAVKADMLEKKEKGELFFGFLLK